MTSCLPTPEDGRGFRFLQGPLTSPSSALQSAFRQVPFEGSCRVKKGPSSWGHGQPGPARPLRVPRSPDRPPPRASKVGGPQRGEVGSGVAIDQAGVGRLSRMDALQNPPITLETERRRRLELQRIEASLKRLEAGDYGYCVASGQPLELRRPERSEERGVGKRGDRTGE